VVAQPLKETLAGKVRLHQHARVEFVSVLKGRLALKVGTDEQILDADDWLYLDSQLRHDYSRAGTKPCSAVVITAE